MSNIKMILPIYDIPINKDLIKAYLRLSRLEEPTIIYKNGVIWQLISYEYDGQVDPGVYLFRFGFHSFLE